jgi:hypothetical protein
MHAKEHEKKLYEKKKRKKEKIKIAHIFKTNAKRESHVQRSLKLEIFKNFTHLHNLIKVHLVGSGF